jgi:hypothetical protein
MTRRIARPVAALAVAASLSACAHEPFDDPMFWHGVALGAEVVALAVALEDDCWTRYDRHGYAYTVCDDDLPPPPRPHRPHRPRH